MPPAQNQVQMFPCSLHVGDRILGHDAAIIFHFDLQLVVRQHPFSQLQDFRESIRPETMLNVPADVRLEQDRLSLSHDTTTIDELFGNVSDLRDMRMRRDMTSVRQSKTREAVRMLFENCAKIREFHAQSIFLLRNVVKLIVRTPTAANSDLLTAPPPDGLTPWEMIRLPNPERRVEKS